MRRVIEKNGRAALVVFAGSLVLAGRAEADAPVTAELPAPPVVASATHSVDPPAQADAPPRDRLLELVVQYLDFAFVRESRDDRTAQLEAPAASFAIAQ